MPVKVMKASVNYQYKEIKTILTAKLIISFFGFIILIEMSQSGVNSNNCKLLCELRQFSHSQLYCIKWRPYW